MAIQNNSRLAEILNKLSTLFENISIELLASDMIWKTVLGILPVKYKGHESQIMEINHKDSTAEKVDNIDRITELAEYFLKEKPTYEYSNLESFSYALRQLIRYSSNDEQAVTSLNRLKDMYIAFITSYYIQLTKDGLSKVASENISYFCKEILNEDKILISKLSNLHS